MSTNRNAIATAVLAGALGGAAAALLLTRAHAKDRAITRWGNSARSSAAVKHGGVVYLSGQVGIISDLATSDIQAQTRQTLAKIDALLAKAGTDKQHLLSANIWVKTSQCALRSSALLWSCCPATVLLLLLLCCCCCCCSYCSGSGAGALMMLVLLVLLLCWCWCCCSAAAAAVAATATTRRTSFGDTFTHPQLLEARYIKRDI